MICSVCNDTHRMPMTGYMCTYCPVPCEVCRRAEGADGRSYPSPYCAHTPCSCECHQEEDSATKRHYSKTLQAILDMGASQVGITTQEARAILRDYETLKQLRQLAGTIPCEMCLIKGGSNILEDGSCRHKPILDSNLTDREVLSRLKDVTSIYLHPHNTKGIQT
jgi:hypothetical protein